PVDDQGVGQLMGLIMFSLMEDRLDSVADYFSITGEVSEREWMLSLKPLSLRLKSALQHIELRGDKYLRKIEIFERDDNRTVIELSDIRGASLESTGPNASSIP